MHVNSVSDAMFLTKFTFENSDTFKIEQSLQTYLCGACVAQRWCNGLPRDGPGFDSQWERCIYRASRTSQGTVNGSVVSN